MYSVAILTADTSSTTATVTKSDLEHFGHTVTLVAGSAITSTDLSVFDVLVVARLGLSSTEMVDHIAEAGVPIVVQPPASTILSGSTQTFTSPLLTDTWRVCDEFIQTATNPSGDSVNITNNSHPITQAFDEGELAVFESNTFTYGIADSEPVVGVPLALGNGSETSDVTLLVAIEQGTLDLDGNAIPVRVVLASLAYSNQGARTLSGRSLINRCVLWAAGFSFAPDPVTIERTTVGRIAAHARAADVASGIFDAFDADDWGGDGSGMRSVAVVTDGLQMSGSSESASIERVMRYLPLGGNVDDIYLTVLHRSGNGLRGLAARADATSPVDAMLMCSDSTGGTNLRVITEWASNGLTRGSPNALGSAPVDAVFHLDVQGTAARAKTTLGNNAHTVYSLADVVPVSGYVGLETSNAAATARVFDRFCAMRNAKIRLESPIADGWYFEIQDVSEAVLATSGPASSGVAEVDALSDFTADPPYIGAKVVVRHRASDIVLGELLVSDAIWPGDEYDINAGSGSEPDSSEPEPEPAARFLVQTECSSCLLAIGEYPTLTVRFQIARADDPSFADPVYDSGFSAGDGTDDDGNVYTIVENLAPGHYLARIHAQTILGPDAISPDMPFTILDLSQLFLGGWRSGV